MWWCRWPLFRSVNGDGQRAAERERVMPVMVTLTDGPIKIIATRTTATHPAGTNVLFYMYVCSSVCVCMCRCGQQWKSVLLSRIAFPSLSKQRHFYHHPIPPSPSTNGNGFDWVKLRATPTVCRGPSSGLKKWKNFRVGKLNLFMDSRRVMRGLC